MANKVKSSAIDLIEEGQHSIDSINRNVAMEQVEDVQPLSMMDEKKAKDAIALMRKKTALRLDGQKLALANQMIDGIAMSIGTLTDPTVNQRVGESIESAQDIMFLANATEKQIKIMQHLMRIDSVDGAGTSARLAVAFETDNGTSFKGLLEFDGM